MNDHPSHIHYAHALIAQARHFREREQRLGWSGQYSAWLLNAAGNARRRAMAESARPAQQELF